MHRLKTAPGVLTIFVIIMLAIATAFMARLRLLLEELFLGEPGHGNQTS